MTYRRLIKNDPSLAEKYRACKLKSQTRARVQGGGPVEALLAAERRLGIHWMDAGLICVVDTDLGLNTCTREALGDHLREAGRRMVWTQARQDARRGLLEHEEAHLQDFGEGDVVDCPLTLKLYNTLRLQCTANAVWTRHARARLPANLGMSPVRTAMVVRSRIASTFGGDVRRGRQSEANTSLVWRTSLRGSGSWPCCTRSCGIFHWGVARRLGERRAEDDDRHLPGQICSRSTTGLLSGYSICCPTCT